MLVKFIYLFTIAIINVQSHISSSRIETDAAEFARLNKKYIERSPHEAFRGLYKISCHVMRECCPEKHQHFFDLMHSHKFERTCIGNRTTSTFKSFSSRCQYSIRLLDSIKQSRDLKRFFDIHREIPNSDEKLRSWRLQMSKVCLASELVAFYCEPENTTKFQACQTKVLHTVAREHGDKGYNAYVNEFRSRYHSYIAHITKAFPHLRSN